jgi:GDP-4-dehydro-6-deoxy-D-mannose reductase
MVVRPFQLIGKGVSEELAPGAFAAKLVNAKAQGQTSITVGNLESYRDFVDVQDAVEAIWALCEKPAAGQIFNICSGVPVKMSELLDAMIQISGPGMSVKSLQDPQRRHLDVPIIFGDYRKIQNHCGWHPKTSLVQSVRKMFDS